MDHLTRKLFEESTDIEECLNDTQRLYNEGVEADLLRLENQELRESFPELFSTSNYSQ